MAEPDTKVPAQIHPGRGIGWITLGASLHAVLTRLKAQPLSYPELDLSYSASDPILQPTVLNLPVNGLRLRFDGPDQRLRLIEVLDFSKTVLIYKNIELVKNNKPSIDEVMSQQVVSQGPPFRHIYNRMFGPSYAGEYVGPVSGSSNGTYVLSYPGISFSFPLKARSWSSKADFVSLLSSTAAGTAAAMAIFQGSSWPEARATLFTATPALPRSLALSTKNKEAVPDEVEEVKVLGAGRLELIRRSSSPMQIVLNQTTPQDLVAELGPPDAIFRKSDSRPGIHAAQAARNDRQASSSPMMRPTTTESDQSSARSYTGDSDDGGHTEEDSNAKGARFYNYFHHGFDALISPPTTPSTAFPDSSLMPADASSISSQLVVTKILLHANIPGSYPFNRHRRSRWTIGTASGYGSLTSEMPFPKISSKLTDLWEGHLNSEEARSLEKPMTLKKGWDESPSSSVEIVGRFDQDGGKQKGGPPSHDPSESMDGLSNTLLYGFPGMLFEVLKGETVTCLTVY